MGRSALFCLLGVMGIAVTALAAPEEIQVYMDEMDNPGQYGLDMHVNDVPSSNVQPAYAGQLPSEHLFRTTPEFSYGLTPNWEMGLYILSTQDAQYGFHVDGEKLRIKYLASKAEGQDWFYGANLEVGRVSPLLDINPWNAELKGIVGLRTHGWTLATNPNIDWVVSGPQSEPATFEEDTKLAYALSEQTLLGVESYNALGPVYNTGVLSQYSQMLYVVLDTNVHGWPINFGVGHGFTDASDRWVIKAIISVPID